MRPGAKMFITGVVIAVLGGTLHELSQGYSVLQLASAALVVGLAVMLIGGLIWFSHRKDALPEDPFAIVAPANEPKPVVAKVASDPTPADKPAPQSSRHSACSSRCGRWR